MELPILPPRPHEGHKGDFGRALIVGGSRGMAGAPALAGMAATRSGAGLTTIATADSCLETVAGFDPNFMTVPLPDDAPLFVNAAAGNFLPAPFSFAIDSAIDSLVERDEFESIKDAIGLALSPVLAPNIDGTGQLRVDEG